MFEIILLIYLLIIKIITKMLRVKDLCKQKKITLKTLAERMDIAPESLHRMISHSGNPTLISLKSMAKALNVEVYELFAEYNPDKAVNGFIEVGDDIYRIRNFADLTDLYKKLTSE